jgi:UDP-glucose 4-epimerase
MKVFITGGMGFVGSHVVLELLQRGDEVTILARNPNKIPAFLVTPGISVIEGGLGDYKAIRAALPGHDACIHIALIWEEAPTELELKDTIASVSLFQAAADAGVEHLIYTSSTAVHRPFKPSMNEGDRIAPDDHYGATKAASEAFLSAFSHQTGMRCNTIRPGPTVGRPAIDGAPVNCDRRFQDIVRAAVRGEDIRVARGYGRQMIGAGDLAKVYSAVLHSGVNRETYLATARNFTSWEQIAEDAVVLAGSTSRVIAEETGLAMAPNVFDVGKIEREFGLVFDSRLSIREYLKYLIGAER